VIKIYKGVSIAQAFLLTWTSLLGDIELDIGTGIEAVVSGVCLILSIIVIGIIAGWLTTNVLNISLKGGVMVNKVKHKNHIVICGWNYQGARIINNILESDSKEKKPIVVLADLEKIPYDSYKVDFIQGSPEAKDNLIKAGIPDAESAIILTDLTGKKGGNPDAEALMITLAIESLNRDVHTCVQLLSSENRIHLENANADEIICLDKVGGDLVVASALNHGVSSIVNELLSFNQGSEFYRYKYKIPDKFIGETFAEVGKQLLDQKMALLAIETKKDEYVINECSDDWIHSTGNEKIMIINPQGNYELRKDDSLFLIAEKEPVNL
jgi:voltage-gated potassium channel